MKPVKKFDYEKFDYDACYNEVINEIKKPNILICGATGVGKSSLINSIFQISESEGATVGNKARPETKGVKKYETMGGSVNLYDSEGYEIGDVGQDKSDAYHEKVLSVIKKLRDEHPGDMLEHIHEVWYCVSAANKRFYDADKKIIKDVIAEHIPIMVLLTKIDATDEEELRNLVDEIQSQIPSVNIYTYSSFIPYDDPEFGKYVQKDEIIKWAMDNLADSLKDGLIPAIKNDIKDKRNMILKEYIPRYSGIAGAVVVGTSFIPVPFSDSVPLMSIQMKMTMSIINAYGIDTSLQQIATGVVGNGIVSYIGKTLAAQLISIIPGVGGGLKATVNVSVAASVTAVLGAAITLVCEQYLKACIDNNGAENLPFAEFFTKEKLKDALEYVKNNKSEFGIDKIIDNIVKNTKK